MGGLILKDLYVLLKQIGIFLAIGTLFMLVGGAFATIFVLALFSLLPITAMAYDEQTKWSNYAIMMPYSKKDLVVSKFLISYIFMAFSVALCTISNIVRIVIFNQSVDFNILLLGVIGMLTFIAINLLANFKFGVEKGRLVYIFCFVIIGSLGNILKDINIILESPQSIYLLVAIGINIISIMVAIKMKHKS